MTFTPGSASAKRTASRGVVALALLALSACSTSPPAKTTRTSRQFQPRPPVAMREPTAARTMALADAPMWIERTRIALMYDGSRNYMRIRSATATGPATRANTRTITLVLGDRSGSQGADRDRDGLSDAAEAALGTDPGNVDTDGDSLPDAFEVFGTCTNPLVADSDGDGTADNLEANLDDPATYADNDGDGLRNVQERAVLGTNPDGLDSDGDGFGDDLEFLFGTPINDRTRPTADADDDGEPDDFERANGTDPASAGSTEPDADGDDVPDWLDFESATMARVPGRRHAVAAGGVEPFGNPNTMAQVVETPRMLPP
jgi:Bacterial TSP3 repeat